MKALASLQNTMFSPIGGAGGVVDQAILKKVDPKLDAKLDDTFTGRSAVRRTFRKFDMVAPLEIERKPSQLTKSGENRAKDRRILRRARRNSIDG